MRLTLDAAGDPTEVGALRWTDANAEKTWRLQPFGGRMLKTGAFEGFRVPVEVELGNSYGTPDYGPVFKPTINSDVYAPH